MLGIALLCFSLFQGAGGVPPQRSPLPTEGGLLEITERGRMLAEYDAASWHATDAVMALKPGEGKIRRYLARKLDSKWVVVFGRLNETGDKFLVSYEATAAEAPEQFSVNVYDPPQEADGFYLSAARAFETAVAAFTAEKRPYNGAVLPTKSGQLYVYIYPASAERNVYLLGGDARYLVSEDGSKILESRRLHKTILEYKVPSKAAESKDGYSGVMGFHNHVLDDVPEDTDVLFAMTRKPSMPETIITWEYTYTVYPDGTIKYEGESAKMFGKKKKK